MKKFISIFSPFKIFIARFFTYYIKPMPITGPEQLFQSSSSSSVPQNIVFSLRFTFLPCPVTIWSGFNKNASCTGGPMGPMGRNVKFSVFFFSRAIDSWSPKYSRLEHPVVSLDGSGLFLIFKVQTDSSVDGTISPFSIFWMVLLTFSSLWLTPTKIQPLMFWENRHVRITD